MILVRWGQEDLLEHQSHRGQVQYCTTLAWGGPTTCFKLRCPTTLQLPARLTWKPSFMRIIIARDEGVPDCDLRLQV